MPTYILDETYTIEVESIDIPQDRQRSEIKEDKLKELASSIREHGIIHPPVVLPMPDGRFNIVVGERRVRAAALLEWVHIEVRFAEDDTPSDELKALEFIENNHRADLSWQDRTRAVHGYHTLMTNTREDWDTAKSAAAFSISRDHTNDLIRVGKQLESGRESVVEAHSFSAARNSLDREFQRQVDNELELLDESFTEGEPLHIEIDDLGDISADFDTSRRPKATRPASKDILNENFLEWLEHSSPKAIGGPKYNFIHCDFPYGIDYDKGGSQTASKTHGDYDDSLDTYRKLVLTLLDEVDNVLASSAHIMFWFSMNYYTWTVDTFAARGFTVNPFPLIWHKADNVGTLPDPSRGPRRVYATALLLHRGDRKIVKPVSNLLPHNSNKSKALHLSEKPEAVLDHFFQMFVDRSTMMLDPTCGSGNALISAEKLGALSVKGLDIIKEFVAAARSRLNISREGRRLDNGSGHEEE